MKKSYTLFTLFVLLIIFCIYSCNNNYTVGPNVTPHANAYDTVLFQTIDSFNVYLNGVFDTINHIIDTVNERDTTFLFAVQGQKDLVLKYTAETNHPASFTGNDSAIDVKIVFYADTTGATMITDSLVYEDIDSSKLAGAKYIDTYRHTKYIFTQFYMRVRINHNHRYGDGQYYIKLKNLKFYKIVVV